MIPRLLLALAAPLLLVGCFLSPGKFTSELELLRDGTFAYRYDGEIHFMGLKQLSQAAAANEAGEEAAFEPLPCRDESDDYAERECSEEELAQQRTNWEAEQERNLNNSEREAAMMKAMFGGLDPADPKAAEELTTRLQRLRGWERVVYKGDGLFDVLFTTRGELDHDFIFPVMEGMPMGNTFVQAILRKEGVIRIEAPGFAAQDPDNPNSAGMGGLFAAMAMSGSPSGSPSGPGDSEDSQPPSLPIPDGTFRIVTDGEILANNTDEGPQTSGDRKVLEWVVNPRTRQAPSALIRFAP